MIKWADYFIVISLQHLGRIQFNMLIILLFPILCNCNIAQTLFQIIVNIYNYEIIVYARLTF